MFRIFRILPLTAVIGLAAATAVAADDSAVIADGMLVSVAYVLSVDGEIVESNVDGEPLVYTQGGNQVLAALEAELAGLRAGEEKSVELTPAEGYGEISTDAYQEVPLDMIPESARQVGAMLQSPDFPGPIRVAEIKEEAIVLDFNHPLAGKALQFDVTVLSVEEAPAAPVPALAPVPTDTPQ